MTNFLQQLSTKLKSNWIIFILLTLLITGIFTPALKNEFVDDDHGIETNAAKNILFTINSGSPLRGILYETTYRIFGLNPTAFRIPNIIFHISNSFLLFLITRSLVPYPVAVMSTFFFAAHPITVESIAWISGGVYPQTLFFFFISLFFFTQKPEQKKIQFVSLISYLLCLISSEKAGVYALLFGLYLISKRVFLSKWKTIIPYFIMAGIFFIINYTKFTYRLHYHQEGLLDPNIIINPFTYAINTLSFYIGIMLFPLRLTAFQTQTAIPFIPLTGWKIILFIFLIIQIFLISRSKTRFYIFFLGLMTIPLIPVIIPSLFPSPSALRYLYTPLTGFITIITSFLYIIFKRLKITFILPLVVLLIISLYVIKSENRILDYRNERSWRLAGIRNAPDNPDAHNYLGGLYLSDNTYDLALREFEIAHKINSNHFPSLHNLGLTNELKGNQLEAQKWYEKALTINPLSWKTQLNLAVILAKRGNLIQSKEHLLMAIRSNPIDPTLYIALGRLTFKMGDFAEAKAAYQKALNLDPQNQIAQFEINQIR